MVRRGEIWVAQLDPKKGAEIGKQRPVLVIQSDLLNQINHPTCIVLPISSQKQDENILRYQVTCSGLSKPHNYVLIDQVRTVDTEKRMKRKIGVISKLQLNQITKLVGHVLDF